MSKKLIIKDADFTVNGITDIGFEVKNALGYDAKDFTKLSSTTTNYYFPNPGIQAPAIAGKTIYGIKVRTTGSGTFQFLKLEGYSTAPTGTNTGTISIVATYPGTNDKIKTILFDNPIQVPDTGNVSFGLRSSKGIYYLNNRDPYLYYVGSPSGSWTKAASYGGGLELLVAAEDIEE